MKKIVLFGNGNSAINIHQWLSKYYNVLSVGDPDDGGIDTWKKSFKKYNPDCLSPLSFKDEGFIQKLKEFKPDIMISCQCSQIIKKEIIDIVNGEIFNIHFADLPKNRGCFPGHWHIRNGDEYAGITLHKLVEKFDAGNIIDQKVKKIEITDTARTIYDWCEESALALIQENIGYLITKIYDEELQNERYVTYYSRKSVNFSFPFVDWNKGVFEVSRFIQAFIFPPIQYAQTRYKNKVVNIKNVKHYCLRWVRNFCETPSMPGTILEKNENFYKIVTKDGIIEVEIDDDLKVGEFCYI